jgi:hypothetical protein
MFGKSRQETMDGAAIDLRRTPVEGTGSVDADHGTHLGAARSASENRDQIGADAARPMIAA